MNKNAYNKKRTKEAAKKQFRLEDDVLISASDRHSDSYRVVTVARPLRDKYNVHLVMSHEPSQKTVYTKTWLFSSMEECWDKFHAIADVVKGIRDFVEVEGIQTVTAQYMMKHNLSAISSDIENMYETAVPYWRSVEDPSSRGNLLQNHPLVPNYVQAGPGSLADVYKSTGNSPNPVPPSKIPSYVHQHVRHEKGMQDIAPVLSGVQIAAQQANAMPSARTAAGNKNVKTGALSSDSFVQKVQDGTDQAVKRGRADSVLHCINEVGCSSDVAEQLYDMIRSRFENKRQKIAIELDVDSLVKFLSEGIYVPDLDCRSFNSKRAKQIANAMDLGFVPVRGTLCSRPKGKRGGCLAVCPLDFGDTILSSGSLDRFRDQAREDFLDNPFEGLYSPAYAADCRTAMAIMGMDKSVLSGSPESIADQAYQEDLGNAEVLLFAPLKPEHVSEIVAGDDSAADKVRRILDQMGKILPVTTCDEAGLNVSLSDEPADPGEAPPVRQKHFEIGDSVGMKPSLNNPSLRGKIADLSNGTVAVQWENGDRHVYDMAEALMRLVTLAGNRPAIDSTVSYELPGMDADTVWALNEARIDPVTVCALASHAQPASSAAKGWEDVLKGSFARIGVRLRDAKGFRYDKKNKAFAKHEWFEAKIPNNNRLIVDMGYDHLQILAGDVDDYVEPMRKIHFE